MHRSLILILTITLLLVGIATADTPQLINYQGNLLDSEGGPVPDDTYSVTFAIYDDAVDGAEHWSEIQSIETTSGGFSVLLGTVEPIHDSVFADTPRFLSVTVDGEEMTPRMNLVSVPYSLRTSTIDGTTGGNITGGITIGIDELVDGNAIIITNLSGDTLYRAAIDQSSMSMAIWEVGDIKGGLGASGGTKKVELNSDGMTVFGATESDTAILIGAGGLEIVVADLGEPGNALVIRDTSGHVQATITANEGGNAELNFYDVVDSEAGLRAIGDPVVSISKDGLTMFGATQADTTLLAFPNGDILSRGQIAVGANSSASGVRATVFGYNNTANDSSCAVGGGAYNTAGDIYSTVAGGSSNTAGGVHSTVGGGNHSTAGGIYSTVAGGTDNIASGQSSTISGGRYHAAIGGYSSIGGGLYDTVAGDYNTIGGGTQNYAGGERSVIGGGHQNRTLNDKATIGGGYSNTASAVNSFIGGGQFHLASGTNATVGGGQGNSATGSFATIGGGNQNTAEGGSSFVGGGYNNYASGSLAIIPGGRDNNADGRLSFAAGQQAKALHDGCFVWGDATDANIASSAPNQFVTRASGGYSLYSNASLSSGVTLAAGGGSWSSLSDRNMKENIEPVDSEEVLSKIASLPISTWNYIAQDESIRHIGPMAQDLHSAFGVGEDERRITSIDADGIALAAIKALNEKNEKLEVELKELRKMVEILTAERNDQ